MSTANRVIKNTGFLYAKMGITMFISLYTTRLILNALGAEDFGIFNIVGGAIAMLGFLNAAMAGATQRFMSYSEGEGNKEKQKKIFNISFVLHLGIALLMGIVLLIAGYFFFNGILNIAPERMYAAKVVYASLIVSTVFTVMTVPYDAVLNAHENMLYYAIVGIIESVFKLAVALLVVVYGGDKLVLYGILMAIIPLITMAIMRVYCHRKYEECVIAPRQHWNKHLMKEMTGFAGWSFLGAGSSMIANYGQSIVLNSFFGATLNAAQGVANQIGAQLSVFASTLQKAVNPVIVKKEGEGNRQSMLDFTLTGSKISYFLLFFFYLPVFIEMPYIFKLWLNYVPEYAVIFCRLQLIRNLAEQLFLNLIGSISAVGKIKKFQLINSALNFLPLFLTYILFKMGYSPIALYIAFLIYTFLNLTLVLIFAIKLCNLNLLEYLKKLILPTITITILNYILINTLHNIIVTDLIRLILVVVTSIVVFTSSVWIIGLDKREKYFIKNLLPKKIFK